jgi:hypothetical protein
VSPESAKILLSALAVVVAIIVGWAAISRNRRIDVRESARDRERMALAKCAALKATFGPKALTIHNDGPASARSIALTLNGEPAAKSTLFGGVRAEQLANIGPIAPGGSVPLTIVTWDGMPRQYDVGLTWDDDSGERGSWKFRLTIPSRDEP